MNKVIVIKKYVLGIFIALLLVTVGTNIYFRYVKALSSCDFDTSSYGTGSFGDCPAAVALITPTPSVKPTTTTLPTPTIDTSPTDAPVTTPSIDATPTDEVISQTTVTPTQVITGETTTTPVPTPTQTPLRNFFNKLITQPGEEPAKIGLPLEDYIENIQKTTEENTPTIIRPVVQEAGAFGLVSLLLLIFDYALIMRFVILGGFLIPFLKLLFSKKGKGQVFNTVTKEPLAFAMIRVTDPASGTIIKKSITNLKGRYSLRIKPGTYNVEVVHRGYHSYFQQFTASNETSLDAIVGMEEDVQSSFSNNFQYSVYYSNPTLIIFLFSFTLSLINLLYVRTFGSVAISLMTTSVWILFRKKRDPEKMEIYGKV